MAVKAFFLDKERPWLLAFVLSGVAVGLSLLWPHRHFLVADDVLMLQIVRGQFGAENAAYTVYISYWVGWVLSHLYAWSPALPWYALTLYGGLFLAWAGIFYSVLSWFRGRNAWWLCILLFALLGALTVVSLTFSLVAVMLAISSVLLAVRWAHRPTFALGAMAGVLLLLASMCRLYSMGLGVVVLLPLLVWTLWENRDKGQRLVRGGLLGLTVVVAVGALHWGSQQQYLQSEAMARYFASHIQLADGLNADRQIQYPYNAQTAPIYARHGWSEADYRLFFGYVIQDSVRNSPQTLHRLTAELEPARVPLSIIGQSVTNHLTENKSLLIGWSLVVVLALIFSSSRRWRWQLLLLGWTVLVWVGIMYFSRAPQHVFWSLLACSAIGSWALAEGAPASPHPLVRRYAIPLRVLVLVVVVGLMLRYQWQQARVLKPLFVQTTANLEFMQQSKRPIATIAITPIKMQFQDPLDAPIAAWPTFSENVFVAGAGFLSPTMQYNRRQHVGENGTLYTLLRTQDPLLLYNDSDPELRKALETIATRELGEPVEIVKSETRIAGVQYFEVRVGGESQQP